MQGRSVLRPGHDTSCPYKNRCEFFNFTELRLDAIALAGGYCEDIDQMLTSHDAEDNQEIEALNMS